MSGAALIAGMIGSIITMALHPTGHDITSGAHSVSGVLKLNIAVHSLALLCLPVLFLGGLGLTQKLASPNRLALSALVFFGFAEAAIMVAAAASGLIAPGLFHHMSNDAAGMADMWRVALQLNGHINQAFAQIYAVAASFAILLWSLAMLRSDYFARALGMLGSIFGPLTILAVVFGHIRLDVHGFGAIILGQAIWFICAGVTLWKEKSPSQTVVV